MRIFTATVLFTGTAHESVEFTILDSEEHSVVRIVRRCDDPGNSSLAGLIQAGIEQFYGLGPGTGVLCHGWAVKYESNSPDGANLVVFEFDYDS